MLNMKWEAQAGVGYQLRITYMRETDKYTVTTYSVYKMSREHYNYERAGYILTFNSLREALDYVIDHKGAKHGHQDNGEEA